MKLHIEFEDDLIKEYDRRGSSPIFSIYWVQDQVAYPEEGWMDFGTVILSWWLVAAKSLVTGSDNVELPFMDGPFCLTLHRVGNTLRISTSDTLRQWQMPLNQFIRELVTTAKQVRTKMNELEISDNTGLELGIKALEKAASNLRTHETQLVASY